MSSLLPIFKEKKPGCFVSGRFLIRTVLPDGRNFGQKAQKGPEKNKVGRKIWWPNFARIWPKMAEKGPEKI
jgi:hypothetical protein